MTRGALALLLLLALAVPAVAQSHAYQDWRRVLDDRQMDNLDRAAWFRQQLEGEDGLAQLRGFVLDPFGARNLSERTSAALALKHRGLRQLEAALTSPHAEVRHAASVAAICRVTRSWVPADLNSYGAAEIFEAHGYDTSSPVTAYLRGLKSMDANERAFCTAVLRSYRPWGDAQYHHYRTIQLLEALEIKDPVLRRGAALGLRDTRWDKFNARVIDGLTKAMKDTEAGVRRAAAEAISHVPARGPLQGGILNALIHGLDDEDDLVATACADSLLFMNSYWSVAVTTPDDLCRAANRKRAPFARAALIRALGTLARHENTGAESVTNALDLARGALKDPEPLVRWAGVQALRAFRTAGAREVEALVARVQDPEPVVRKAVVLAFPKFKGTTPMVAEAVVSALEDRSPEVRRSALLALRGLQSSDPAWAARHYAARTTDPNWRVRTAAATGLWLVGRAALPHVKDLVRLLGDAHTHATARKALQSLRFEVVTPLFKALKAAEADNRFDLINILGSLGWPAFPAFFTLVTSEDRDLIEAGLAGLSRVGPGARLVETQLLEILTRGPEALHPLTAWTVYRIGLDRPPSKALREAARTHGWCAWALAAIARHNGETSRPVSAALVELLDHADPALGETAADALAAMAVEPARKNPWFADPALEDSALVACLQKTDAAARKAAARTLAARPEEKSLDFRATLLREYGVMVDTPATSKKWTWLPEIRASATPLPSKAARTVDCRLLLALAAYPARMVRPRLKKIVVVKILRVGGMRYGGTYRDKVLYLAAGDHPNLDLTRAFHHEFSSLLMKSAPFPDKAWQAIHDSGPVYGKGGRWAIYMGRTGVGTVDLYRKGFFRPYALADLENDFNVFSDTAMTYPHWARTMAARYPRLGQKWKTWCAFLKSLDKAFTPPLPLPSAK